MTKTTINDLLDKAEVSLDFFNIPVAFAVDFVYNSLLFENDNWAAEDVKTVVVTRQISDNKKDIIIRNHFAALVFSAELVKGKNNLGENDIKDIHEILMQDLAIGGLYRNVDISVKGSTHIPPNYMKVYDRMKKYINTVASLEHTPYHMFAYSLLQFAKIHPFLDGNGRCARLILFYHMLKHSRKPVVIPYSRSVDYFNFMEEFKVNKNIIPFIEFLKELNA